MCDVYIKFLFYAGVLQVFLYVEPVLIYTMSEIKLHGLELIVDGGKLKVDGGGDIHNKVLSARRILVAEEEPDSYQESDVWIKASTGEHEGFAETIIEDSEFESGEGTSTKITSEDLPVGVSGARSVYIQSETPENFEKDDIWIQI